MRVRSRCTASEVPLLDWSCKLLITFFDKDIIRGGNQAMIKFVYFENYLEATTPLRWSSPPSPSWPWARAEARRRRASPGTSARTWRSHGAPFLFVNLQTVFFSSVQKVLSMDFDKFRSCWLEILDGEYFHFCSSSFDNCDCGNPSWLTIVNKRELLLSLIKEHSVAKKFKTKVLDYTFIQ